ncbi:membrane protein insertase YidC [Bacteriovoracaceae bacterium]|nr:membrane protein insertase YidC [Bacteriovoracaceae bacterium]
MTSESRRMILAVTLSGLILFTWQAFFAPKNTVVPQTQNKIANQNNTSQTTAETPSNTTTSAGTETSSVQNNVKKSDYIPSAETLSKIGFEYRVTSNLTVDKVINPRAVYSITETTGSEHPFRIQAVNGPNVSDLRLNLKNDGERITGNDPNLGIKFVGSISDDGKLYISLKSDKKYSYRILFQSAEKELSYSQKRSYVFYTKEVDRVTVGSDDDGEGTLNWSGVDYNYHLLSFVNANPGPARYKTFTQGEVSMSQVDYINSTNNFDGYVIFAKKNYDNLAKLGDNLQLSVDFGFFGIIAVPILRGLQFFYKYVPNYGISIILLTILIRLLTFPLQFKSFKSMKKMQDVQPELQKIREKFKDDPQRLQRESMDLFKKAGANPLGGLFTVTYANANPRSFLSGTLQCN